MRKKVKYLDNLTAFQKLALDESGCTIVEDVEGKIKILYPDTMDEAVFDEANDQYTISGDIGSGRPGSMQWSTTVINQMKTREEVSEYVKELSGKDIEPKGRLDYLKKNAIRILTDWNNDNS